MAVQVCWGCIYYEIRKNKHGNVFIACKKDHVNPVVNGEESYDLANNTCDDYVQDSISGKEKLQKYGKERSKESLVQAEAYTDRERDKANKDDVANIMLGNYQENTSNSFLSCDEMNFNGDDRRRDNKNNYQEKISSFAIYPKIGTGSIDAISYVTLGLVGEAGEVAEKVKKILRDNKGTITNTKKEELILELGDVFWYLVSFCTELNV